MRKTRSPKPKTLWTCALLVCMWLKLFSFWGLFLLVQRIRALLLRSGHVPPHLWVQLDRVETFCAVCLPSECTVVPTSCKVCLSFPGHGVLAELFGRLPVPYSGCPICSLINSHRVWRRRTSLAQRQSLGSDLSAEPTIMQSVPGSLQLVTASAKAVSKSLGYACQGNVE